MRIAITHAFCWPEVRRGGERFIQMLGAALVRRGHDVVILSAGFEAGESELDGVVTRRLPRTKKKQFRHEADFAKKLLPILRDTDFDAVHSLGRHDAVASIEAARGHPHRRTVLTDLGTPNREWWATVGRREAKAVETVVAGIDVYSAMSAWAIGFLAATYDRHDGVVIPGGVSMQDFTPADQREAAPTLLFSGAVDEARKGVSVLLDALPAIAQREPEVQLWLSGPGDPGPALKRAPAEARRRTTVLGLGEAEAQAERYKRAWVTTLPSVGDSFGMALVESLACGTPIAVTTHGAPSELVTAGTTGAVCEPEDPAGLARACLDAIDLARRPETVAACRARAQDFDWDTSIAPLCEGYYRGTTPAG